MGTSEDCSGFGFRAFLWENGSIVDLNSLAPPGSQLTLQFALNINDHGEIAVASADAVGNGHAVLLVPCDENHSNIEGCDYSLVEASAVAGAHPTVAAPVSPAQPKLPPREVKERIRSLMLGRRRFGLRQPQ